LDTLGISSSTEHLAEPDRRGLWPDIASAADAAHWIHLGAGTALVVALCSIILCVKTGNPASAAIEAAFLVLGAAGIVRASRFAAACTVAAIVLLIVAASRHQPYSFSGLILLTQFVLHAVRSVWFLNRTGLSLPPLNRNRFLNALAGPLPKALWGAGRFVYYAMAAVGLPWLVYRIFAPIAPGAKWRGVVEFPWM
jgi:hypothetical protein